MNLKVKKPAVILALVNFIVLWARQILIINPKQT